MYVDKGEISLKVTNNFHCYKCLLEKWERSKIKMKFIFPKNYNFKSKIFGVIDYSSLFINIVWDCFIFCLVNLIFTNLTIKIFIFIISCLPLLLFSIIGQNNENLLYVINYLLKFTFSNKIFLFDKRPWLYCKRFLKML